MSYLQRSIQCIFIFLFCFSSQMVSQVATGVYPQGSFDTRGFDTINLGNLNVNFAVPVFQKQGRGVPFSYILSYDSSVWVPAVSGSTTAWTPVQAFGWSADTQASLGYLTYSMSTKTVGGGNRSNTCNFTYYGNWNYHDPFGVTHYFPVGTYTVVGGDSCGLSDTSATATAVDNSGYTLAVTANTSAVLTSAAGKQILAPTTVTGSGSYTDTNGNQITADGNGHFTDTTGNVVLTVAGSAPSSKTFTYTDSTGTARAVTMAYAAYTVQTDFGCSGISEYGPTSTSLVSSLTLADGSTYSFSYEPTPGSSGNVTGRLASVTLPQGGVIKYAYSGGSGGIVCADGSTASLMRTMPNDPAASKWTYARTVESSTASSTAVTDGLNNAQQYTFVQAPLASAQTAGPTAYYFETSRSMYQGAASGTPLLSRQTCYNGASAPCTTTALTLPLSTIAVTETLNGIEEHGWTDSYNVYGLHTDHLDYDFGGASSLGALLRQEIWTYPSSGIVSLVSADTVYDGNNNKAGSTAYSYDTTSVTATSGLPQHSGTIGSQRGNLTQVSQFYSAGGSLTSTINYEDTGDALTSATPNGTTHYVYDTPTHAFLTSATPPTPSSGVSLPQGSSNDPISGALLSTTDPNNQAVTYKSYDPLIRPLEVDNPDGGKTTFTYSPTQIDQSVYQSANVYTEVEQQYDSYGRPSRSAISNGQSSNPWYQQDTCYDAAGNQSFISTPYQGSGFSTAEVCANTGTTYTHDGLGRVTEIAYADGTTKHFAYSGRAIQSTDENGVAKIAQVDGLGRTTAVCEVSSSSLAGGGTPAACGLDINGTGYLTTYAYTLATGTTTVTQGAQTRIFQTDWLGRTTSVQEPESGVTTYSYAYNSTGLQVTRKRPTANQTSSSTLTTTSTQYDSIGRPVSITYSDGTPTKSFQYDAQTSWPEGSQQQNMKGRLALEGRSTASGYAGSIFSYDQMGRVVLQFSCMPSGCGNEAYDHTVPYSYNWAGMLTSEGDGAGATYTYARSQAGEITAIRSSFSDSTDPANIIASGTVVNTVFGPSTYQLGNNLISIRTYDSMGRNVGGWVCSGSSQPGCSGGSQTYGYTAQFSGKQMTGGCDTVVNNCAYYGYDNFNRLTTKSVSSGTAGSFLYSYDRYGNRWDQTVTAGNGPSPELTFNTSTNQMTGYSYDAAGNLTNDHVHSYTYDGDNNVISVDGGSTATYTYDSLNQRTTVARGGSGGSYEFVFDAAGRRVSTWIAGTHAFGEAIVYSDSGPVAFRVGGSTHFEHQDYLGTGRVNSGYSGTTEGTFSSLPFGDGYTASGEDWDWAHYAGTDHDPESSTEHANFRQYSSTTGHWMSPDPYYGSYRLQNPQSLNRYTYSANNPMSRKDPRGLDDTDPTDADPTDGSDDGGGSGDPCGDDPNCVTTYAPPDQPDPDCGYDACVTADPPSDPETISAPNNTPTPAIPYKVCVAAALYNELTSIKSYTDKANADLGKTYGVGLGLLGPAAFLKYGIGGSAVTGGGLLTSYVAGAFAKAYFVTVPSFASGVAGAASQYKQDVKACGGG